MKKKQLACFVLASALTVVASSSLLCGNAIVSYEDVTDKTQTVSDTVIFPRAEVIVSNPVYSSARRPAMVRHTWTGDKAGYITVYRDPSPSATGLTLKYEENEEDRYVYEEYTVPSAGTKTTVMDYFAAESFVETTNGDVFSSSSMVRMASASSVYTVSGTFDGSTLTYSGVKKTIYFQSGHTIFVSGAYKGLPFDFNFAYESVTNNTMLFTLDDVTFTFEITRSYIQVSTSKSVECERACNKFSDNAVIGYAIVQNSQIEY